MSETFQASAAVEVDAPPERVWQVLTEPELVARYMHGTTLETGWQVGGPVVWRGEMQGRAYEDKGEVIAVEPPRRLAFTHWSPLTGEPDTPENQHHISYEIEPVGDGSSRLTLTHANSPSQEAADGMVENGWQPMLQSLKEVAEAPA